MAFEPPKGYFTECMEAAVVDVRGDEDPDHVLICSLDRGHDGFHYDRADNITWKEGPPDGV
jgi:hypothetical protein